MCVTTWPGQGESGEEGGRKKSTWPTTKQLKSTEKDASGLSLEAEK